MAALDRGCVEDQPQRSTLQRLGVNPTLTPSRSVLRWQPAAPKQSEGGSIATTPLSPAQYIAKSPSPLTRTIRHSSFGLSSSVSLRVHPWLKIFWNFVRLGKGGKLAERGGFEPPIRLLTVYRFSKPAPSATRPSLHRVE